MLEIATTALAGSSAIGLSELLRCFLCNMHHRPIGGIPGSGPGLGTPAAGGPDDEPDRCAGEQRNLLQAQSLLDMVQKQIDAYKAQIEALRGPMTDLLQKMSSLADACRNEVLWYLLDQLLDKAADVVLGEIPLAEILSDPTGITDTAGFIQEMQNYYTLTFGSWQDLGQMAQQEGMTAISAYVAAMQQLHTLIQQGYQLTHLIEQKKEELAQRQKDVQDAQAALDACMAAAA